MDMSDELAYMSATELALRIRRRDLSPVEVIEAFHRAHRGAQPEHQRLRPFRLRGCPSACAERPNRRLMSGAALGPLHGVPVAIKDLFDFKPGWTSTFGGVRALKNNVVDFYCAFAERVENAGAIIVGKTNSPVHGVPRDLRQLSVRTRRAIRSTQPRTAAGRRAGAQRPLPTACCRWRRGPTVAAPSASRRRGAASTVTSSRSGACRSSRALTRSLAHAPFLFEGPHHPHGRRRCARLDGPRGLRSARSLQSRRAGGLHGRHATLDPGMEDRLQPGLRRIPDRSSGDRCRQSGRKSLRGGRCARRGGQGRHHAAAEGAERPLVPPDHATERRRRSRSSRERDSICSKTIGTTFHRSTCAGST